MSSFDQRSAWTSSAEDFGQKVDLTVRIREILRNYPEGLSIIKELIQNADDAGARTIRLCSAEARPITNPNAIAESNPSQALCNLMEGPSLLAYNSAKFTETDFKSIQQIGDSLKKDKNGTKTGRFGVGVNSTYHLTDVPMFVSGTKLVLFDPQTTFVPGINPANPGKLIDCSKANGRDLIKTLPQVFDPLKIFGCQLDGTDFNGTTFRFALRTSEQAKVSKLSKQAHTLDAIRELLTQMSCEAPSMLLFLKNVECIEIYDWKANDDQPTMIHRTAIHQATENVRKRRSFVLDASSRVPTTPQSVDYFLDIVSEGIGTIQNGGKLHNTERWIVCNQLGGGQASVMASDPSLSHMKLVPWAGVAARVSPTCDITSGAAYCFLPLPVQTKLPVHVNGYFELSSNRRDVWWGDDMAGDGLARANWNKSLVADIAAPCYCRLIAAAIRTKVATSHTYEHLFPQKETTGPWKILISQFFKGIANLPVLAMKTTAISPDDWVTPSQAIFLQDDNDSMLTEVFTLDKQPLVLIKNKDIKNIFLSNGVCKNIASPKYIREYFRNRNKVKEGSLEHAKKLEYAEYLLNFALSDINANQYGELAGCQFIPLASGNLGRFSILPHVESSDLLKLLNMGFTKLACMHAIRVNKFNIEAAMEWLLVNQYEDTVFSVHYGIDPYLVCDGEVASLLKPRAADTFIDVDNIQSPILKKFFISTAMPSSLNIVKLDVDMLPDVVSRILPREWRGADVSSWDISTNSNKSLSVDDFARLWRYIYKCSEAGISLSSISEQFCTVPTNQKLVCSLSRGSSVLDTSGIDSATVESLVKLGIRTVCFDALPRDVVMPKDMSSYLFRADRDGVIGCIESALRRHATMSQQSNSRNVFDLTTDNDRELIFEFFANPIHGSLSTESISALRKLPIYRASTNDPTEETVYVSMVSSADRWFVLEDEQPEDKLFLTSNFIVHSNKDQYQLLLTLGAHNMCRSDFLTKIVIPQLNVVPTDVRNNIVTRVLVDLPSIIKKDPSFLENISKMKFIPSAATGALKSPSELYDPDSHQLLSLMDEDSFPDEYFCDRNFLISLRSIGLQSTLTWDVVLECAQSIEEMGTSSDEMVASSANRRGRELLIFLDMNVESFFPEFKKKSDTSRTSRLFRKMNSVLFEDPEQKKLLKQVQADRIQRLLNIKWMPIIRIPPHPFLPWPERCEYVASPIETASRDRMWLLSYNKRLVDGEVHSVHLKKLFGWQDDVSITDVAIQLKMLSLQYMDLRTKIECRNNTEKHPECSQNINYTMSDLNQTVTSEVGHLYHILDSVNSQCDSDLMKSILYDHAWLWMGEKFGFVPSDHVAFSSSINATPYLFTVPPDLACFRNLLSLFSVRHEFGSSDYCMVLRRMADEKDELSKQQSHVELAVNLVQKISDDVLKLGDAEIYAPSEKGDMVLSSMLVYDDTPWLSKDLPGKKDLIYAHPKLSIAVSEKIGIKSVRSLLLNSNTNMINFGEGVVHEAFGQSESLTRRLKNIVEMYPEGPQQLQELIQNADDAGATVVRFIVSKKSHGKSSLLGQKMSEWQGPALYCYNNSVFTPRDFQNLARIGQASKLEKLVTTGRFGLGFNSVFHWTDVPSFVSGDHLVMFDPHAKYVPGATDTSRGIKIRFTNSPLVDQFPDQMLPYCVFGNDMKNRFEGTIFRFPFRNSVTGAQSEISKTYYSDNGAIEQLLASFKKNISKILLFLRHVERVEVYLEDVNDAEPQLLYFAAVKSREPISKISSSESSSVVTNLTAVKSMASARIFGGSSFVDNSWNSISNFIAGSDSQSMSKEAFYSKLLRTPEAQLPRTKHRVSILFRDYSSDSTEYDEIKGRNNDREPNNPAHEFIDTYVICSALGAGECRTMACNPKHRDMKFLPWGNVAAHLYSNQTPILTTRGHAFCFLPLPSETGFPVHINGYFELSANRRDIWSGDDMSGSGLIRSQWNRLLLKDVIGPLYCELLLSLQNIIGPGEHYNSLWPIDMRSDVWNDVRNTVYEATIEMGLLHSQINKGRWVSAKQAVLIDTETSVGQATDSNDRGMTSKLLLSKILLEEELDIVSVPSSIINLISHADGSVRIVNHNFVRRWFKLPVPHKTLNDRQNVTFLLKYCIDDLVEGNDYTELYGLPLIPLVNGRLGVIAGPESTECFYTSTEGEKYLLEKASFRLVDLWTGDDRLNTYLLLDAFQKNTNIKKLSLTTFSELLSYAYPPEWYDLPEVQWVPTKSSLQSSPENPMWLSKLWDYIVFDSDGSERDISMFENTWPMVPTYVGDGLQTLQILANKMAVVNLFQTACTDDNLSNVLHSIGLRTLDSNVFKGKDTMGIIRKLSEYIHQPTAKGIIQALINTFPEDIDNDILLEKMTARFDYVSDNDRDCLRNFFRDSERGADKDPKVYKILRSLPIYPIYRVDGSPSHGQLTDERFLPPQNADSSILDSKFLRVNDKNDIDFFIELGASTMPLSTYYEGHVCQIITENLLGDEVSHNASLRLLRDLPIFLDGDNSDDILSRFSNMKIIPNIHGDMVRAKDLFDPEDVALVNLVDESMLPPKKFRQPSLLQSLRRLGMKTNLSSRSVLDIARSIEKHANTVSLMTNIDENDVNIVRKRSLNLLNFLDDENILEGLTVIDDTQSSGNKSIEVSVEITHIFEELAQISWLPVQRSKRGDFADALPPTTNHQLSYIGISSPQSSRPKSDEWLCSSSLDILSITIRSERLLKLFNWDQPPGLFAVATQVIALAESLDKHLDSQAFRQTLASITSKIYEIIDANIDLVASDEQERVLTLLGENPWIWVGSRFVATSQVAYDAPENAQPYLYSVPNQMLCFTNLLRACAVKDSFTANDYTKLLAELTLQLDGQACNEKQLDLAIFISRNLSRISDKDIITLDKELIYLPSRDGTMHKATQMTYDDAPWLSAIVKHSRHVFVHNDVGNEPARILGAKSLRDVLSAHQNGMVKIPCPKIDSLAQLLSKRVVDVDESCRIVQEVLEIAEIKQVRQVSVTVDYRDHGTLSLLHPCLAVCQKQSLFICFHDVAMDVDDIVKLTSPSKFYSSSIGGGGGCGGAGFPRFGRGLAGVFALTDCLQVMSGKSFMVFDPNGEYLIEDKVPKLEPILLDENEADNTAATDANELQFKRKEKATARNYGMSLAICKQFPDQFAPFLSLPFGIEESMVNSTASGPFFRGTIFRIPFRSSDSPPSLLCKSVFDEDFLKTLVDKLEKSLPNSLLFTYHLQSLSLDQWLPAESTMSRKLQSRISSSPLSRRNHREDMCNNSKWKKDKKKLSSIFSSSWTPELSSYTLQISHRHSDDSDDIIDTYVIQSVLAPSRLRELACTDALSPTKLIPAVTIAAHIHRCRGSVVIDTDSYILPEGTIFVGLDTNLKTGLPFHINAPLFLHEWYGTIILSEDDDKDLRATFPGIRDVLIHDKNYEMQRKSLALHAWNKQALTSTIELIPHILNAIKDPLQFSCSENPRLLYRFWPYYSRVNASYKDFLSSALYRSLASKNMAIYLTERNGFKTIDEGCVASPDYELKGAAIFFMQKMSLFTIPRQVVSDLNVFGIETKVLSPSSARLILKKSSNLEYFSRRPSEALHMLKYCLSDLHDATTFTPGSKPYIICKNELVGLNLLPLADGTVGTFGRGIIVATAEQQAMLPSIKSKFLLTSAFDELQSFFQNKGFLDVCGLIPFDAKVLSDHIWTVLPGQWKGKDFVKFQFEESSTACSLSPLWIYQFWREVPIWNHDKVQLFRDWPLIPTSTGELASCGSVRFILTVHPYSNSSTLKDSLQSQYTSLTSKLEQEKKRCLILSASSKRFGTDATTNKNIDEQFWNMGMVTASENAHSNAFTDRSCDEHNPDMLHDSSRNDPQNVDNIDLSFSSSANDENDISLEDSNDIPSSNNRDLQNEFDQRIIAYDSNCASLIVLRKILSSLEYPLLEPSFFEDDELTKTLPTDRVGLSRSILNSLNQCINYWEEANQPRLKWNNLSNRDYDDFISHLCNHQNNRLSFMPSDLNLLKSLPVFETFSGQRVSISDRDENFTCDESVNFSSVSGYLPRTLQSKLLVDKPGIKELYEDLNIKSLNEATILEKFVLKEFDNMPASQKDLVIKNILSRWNILRLSDTLVNVLKETSFVKRENSFGNTVFVKPSELYDPRNSFFALMFDNDNSCFPIEEFSREDGLELLIPLGLKCSVDKEAFLKCALIVESEQNVAKALKLFEHFSEHIGDFYDNSNEFSRKLSDIRCVPAEKDGDSIQLYYFRDTASPKDRHLTFKILPVIHTAATPPQVMYSALGIVSPPTISTVLQQLRVLTDDDTIVDHWTYKHGSVDKVFSSLFSFLQDCYSDLSPRVQKALSDRPLVPVGTSLVKSNRLFFRLTRDLSPFFYEVPRAFGAYDVLLRSLGVRDSPKSDDYAQSLVELNNEISYGKMNANELKSVVEVVNLLSEDDNFSTLSSTLLAPNSQGKLVKVNELLQNDCPWLVRGGKLDMNRIHLVHPKLSGDLCCKLQIAYLSDHLEERLNDNFIIKEIPGSFSKLSYIENSLRSTIFVDMIKNLSSRSCINDKISEIAELSLKWVESLQTKFVLSSSYGSYDVTNTCFDGHSACFIKGKTIYVSNQSGGSTVELVVAAAIADRCKVDRVHVAGLAAILCSGANNISLIRSHMNLFIDHDTSEKTRGEPGSLLVPADRDYIEIKPLKIFHKGEIVAVRERKEAPELIYGIVISSDTTQSLSRLRVQISKETEADFMSSEIFTFRSGSKDDTASSDMDEGTKYEYSKHLIPKNHTTIDDVEDLVAVNGTDRARTIVPVKRGDIVKAVSDLLQYASLSLDDDTQKMLNSNLALQEQIDHKAREIESLENKCTQLSKKWKLGMDAFLCPITRDIMQDPVICADGHTYERSAIEMWLRSNSRSPKTNQQLASREIIPNHALRGAIESLTSRNDGELNEISSDSWE